MHEKLDPIDRITFNHRNPITSLHGRMSLSDNRILLNVISAEFLSINLPYVETEITTNVARTTSDLFIGNNYFAQPLKSLVSFTYLTLCTFYSVSRLVIRAFFQKPIQSFSLSLNFSNDHRVSIVLQVPTHRIQWEFLIIFNRLLFLFYPLLYARVSIFHLSVPSMSSLEISKELKNKFLVLKIELKTLSRFLSIVSNRTQRYLCYLPICQTKSISFL